MFRNSFNVNRMISLLSKEVKSNEEVEIIYRYLSQFEDFNKITSKISKIEKQQLLRNLSVKTFSAGEIIFTKGDPINNFYIVLSGLIEHIITEKGLKIVHTYTTGKQVGDKSYMKQAIRTSHCISATDSALLDISLEIFRELLGEDAHMLLHKKLKFIDLYFPGIKKYSSSNKERIAYMFDVLLFKKGTVIYKQGDIPEIVYFLCDGEVALTNNFCGIPILKLTPGSCFGEEIVIGGKNTYTSVVSSEQAILYAMKKNEVLQYIPEETREA